MESTDIATLQLPSLRKQALQIHILPKTQTDPLISLGVICDNGCTITLYKQENVYPEELRRNNQRDQKQEDRNVGSAPRVATIRKCGKQHSGTKFKTRTRPVFICITATKSKQSSKAHPRCPKNADSPINIIRSFMRLWMHRHTRQTRNFNPE